MDLIKSVLIHLLLASLSLQAVKGQASYHDIRLIDKAEIHNSYKGRLEVLINGQWGAVCDDAFGLTEANVACGQLGFEEAAFYGPVGELVFAVAPTSDDPPILLDEVWCEPNDTSIQDCSHSGVGVHDCAPYEAVGLVCLTNGTLRLTNGFYLLYNGYGQINQTYGRLEVYTRGEWGTVCGSGFDKSEADVACQSMGFSGSDYYGPFFYFGVSIASDSTPIWLENVRCSENDSTLLSCEYNPIGSNNTCTHWGDTALACTVEKETSMVGLIISIVVGTITSIPFCSAPLIILCCFCGVLYSKKRSEARRSRAPVVAVNTAQITNTGQLNLLQPQLYPHSSPYPTQQASLPAHPPQPVYPVQPSPQYR